MSEQELRDRLERIERLLRDIYWATLGRSPDMGPLVEGKDGQEQRG
jgi:hypothetical protein